MKKIVFALFLLFSFCNSYSQITYTPQTAAGYQFKYVKSDSGFALPFIDTSLRRGVNRIGAVVARPQDSLLYYWTGAKWSKINADVSGLISLINSKVDSVTVYGDELKYWVNGTSTLYNLSTISGTLNSVTTNGNTTANTIEVGKLVSGTDVEVAQATGSDVLFQLVTYFGPTIGSPNRSHIRGDSISNDNEYYLPDTTGMFVLSVNGTRPNRKGNVIIASSGSGSFDTATIYNNLALKLNIADTSAMLNNYVNQAGNGLQKLSSKVVGLGGTLDRNTTIDGGGFNFSIGNTNITQFTNGGNIFYQSSTGTGVDANRIELNPTDSVLVTNLTTSTTTNNVMGLQPNGKLTRINLGSGLGIISGVLTNTAPLGTDTSTTVGFGLIKTIASNNIELKVDSATVATQYKLNLTNAQVTANTTAITQRQLLTDTTTYDATKHDLNVGLATKQATLISGTNIKTVNGNSLLGSGDVVISGGGSGVTTLNTIGSTPNDSAATITGTVLRLQPASSSFGGVLTTGTQTWAGDKTNNDNFTIGKSLYLPNSSGTNGNIYKGGSLWAHNLGASTYNTFLGKESGSASAGTGSVGIGGAVMSGGTANFSVGIGFAALQGFNDDAAVAIGKYAMQFATGGSNAVAIGTNALQNVTSGFSNIAIGKGALSTLTVGTGNVVVAASTNVGSGDFNTFIGSDGPLAMTSGLYNTQVGGYSQQLRRTGNYNTTLGAGSLQNDTTGNNNTVLGTFAGQNLNGNSNVLLGYGAGNTETVLNGKLIINNTTSTTHLINGDFGGSKVGINKTMAATVAGSSTLQIGGTVSVDNIPFVGGSADTVLTRNATTNQLERKLAGGGSSLTYPNTTGKYLNGYGAFPTLNTDSITQGTTNRFTQWLNSGSDVYYNTGSVGVGTSSPVAGLHIATSSLIRGNSGSFTQTDIDVPGTTYGSGNGFSLIGLGTGYSGPGGALTNASAVLVANSGSNMSNGMAIGALNSTGTLRMYTGGNNERMRIAANGDVSIANLTTNGYVKTSGGTGLLTVSSTIPATDIANTVVSNKSANYTITSSDNTINATTSAIVITLPTAVGINGQEFTIINSSSGNITIATTSSQLIGNFTTSTTYTLASDKSVTVKSDNSNYKIKISN